MERCPRRATINRTIWARASASGICRSSAATFAAGASAAPQKPDTLVAGRRGRFGPRPCENSYIGELYNQTIAPQQTALLFDNLVGELLHEQRHIEA
jgi:hypothetical protein